MIERLRSLSITRRHPRPGVLSRYWEGDLDVRRRRAVEAHVRGCARCQQLLASLASTVRALGSLAHRSPAGLADSIVEALRAEPSSEVALARRSRNHAEVPALTVVRHPGPPVGNRIPSRWPDAARAALRWCLQAAQLRLTLPITLVAGVVLIVVNQGGTLLPDRITVVWCVMCATDFLVPFVALNLGLLLVVRIPGRTRP